MIIKVRTRDDLKLALASLIEDCEEAAIGEMLGDHVYAAETWHRTTKRLTTALKKLNERGT